MIYIASAYSMLVRERELELNSVKKSNTSRLWKSTALILGARFLSHAYLQLLSH